METTDNNTPSPPPSTAVESRHDEQQRRPLPSRHDDDDQRAAAAAPRQQRRHRNDGDDDQDGTRAGDDVSSRLPPSLFPSSTASSSSSSHLTRLPPPLPSSSSSIPNHNHQDGEEGGDTAAVPTAAAAATEATMPFLLHRGEDGSVPTDDEIVAALSANIDLLASAMRRDGEMTDTYESEIQEMKQMLSTAEEMLTEADANVDAPLPPPPTTTTTTAGDGGGGGGVVDTRSAARAHNAIAHVNRRQQVPVSSPPSNDEGATPTLPAPTVTAAASSSSRNQQDTGAATLHDDDDATGTNATTAITGKTPRTSLTPSYLQEAAKVSMEGKAAEIANLSDQEKKALFEDFYGRKPGDTEKVERLLLVVDEELGRIPPEEMATATYVRAREAFPSPFHSSRHVLLFLNVEDFDPKRAARRMARYWEMRVRYYGGGDRAFSSGTYSLPSDEDQLRIYHKSLATLNDADSTQPIKDAASAFLAKFCDNKLKDLDVQIAAQDRETTAPYLAYKKAHPHIFNTCHHLGFLQASDFNPVEAAKRIVKHWYFYDRLFGSRDADGSLVYTPVTLSNSLSEDCLELMFEGNAVRVMCDEDDHGRGLVYCNIWALIRSGLSNSDVARVIFCTSKIIHEIESAKYKGFVLLSDHADATGASEEEKERVYGLYNVLFPMSNGGFPVALRAVHRLNPPPMDLYEKIDHVLSRHLRVRITHINGETQEERLSKLAESYGISKSFLPDIIGGDAGKEEWTQWLDEMIVEGY